MLKLASESRDRSCSSMRNRNNNQVASWKSNVRGRRIDAVLWLCPSYIHTVYHIPYTVRYVRSFSRTQTEFTCKYTQSAREKPRLSPWQQHVYIPPAVHVLLVQTCITTTTSANNARSACLPERNVTQRNVTHTGTGPGLIHPLVSSSGIFYSRWKYVFYSWGVLFGII